MRPRWKPPRKRVVYVKQEPVNIEALAAKMAEQMVAKILDKLPAATHTTIIQSAAHGPATEARDGVESIAIDDSVIASESSDITGIEKAANIQETKTTHDSTLQSSKDKLSRLKKG